MSPTAYGEIEFIRQFHDRSVSSPIRVSVAGREQGEIGPDHAIAVMRVATGDVPIAARSSNGIGSARAVAEVGAGQRVQVDVLVAVRRQGLRFGREIQFVDRGVVASNEPARRLDAPKILRWQRMAGWSILWIACLALSWGLSASSWPASTKQFLGGAPLILVVLLPLGLILDGRLYRHWKRAQLAAIQRWPSSSGKTARDR